MDNFLKSKKQGRKVFKGTVVSSKNNCTIVAIENFYMHPKYKKYISKRKKYKAHDLNSGREVGSEIFIEESRPISKDKRFRVIEKKV
jgi:small subunit ribosomal protein S17